MTEEEARKKMEDTKVTPNKRGMTPEEAVRFYNQHLKNPLSPPKLSEPKKEPWWLKPLLLLFATLVFFGVVSMCNHSLKESSGVGIETTIRSHGN